MQENGKFIIYTPCFQEIIKAILQLIIQFPVKNQQQKGLNTFPNLAIIPSSKLTTKTGNKWVNLLEFGAGIRLR